MRVPYKVREKDRGVHLGVPRTSFVDRGTALKFTNYRGQTHSSRKERAFLRDKVKHVKLRTYRSYEERYKLRKAGKPRWSVERIARGLRAGSRRARQR
jgi:hypothetical protein